MSDPGIFQCRNNFCSWLCWNWPWVSPRLSLVGRFKWTGRTGFFLPNQMPISSHNALHGRNALILSKQMGPILSNIPRFFANRGRKKKPRKDMLQTAKKNWWFSSAPNHSSLTQSETRVSKNPTDYSTVIFAIGDQFPIFRQKVSHIVGCISQHTPPHPQTTRVFWIPPEFFFQLPSGNLT